MLVSGMCLVEVSVGPPPDGFLRSDFVRRSLVPECRRLRHLVKLTGSSGAVRRLGVTHLPDLQSGRRQPALIGMLHVGSLLNLALFSVTCCRWQQDTSCQPQTTVFYLDRTLSKIRLKIRVEPP